MENIRGRGFMDRSCCDRPRFPAAIRALDDREKGGERERERNEGKGGRRERGRGKKSIVALSITIHYWLRAGQLWCVFAITPDK